MNNSNNSSCNNNNNNNKNNDDDYNIKLYNSVFNNIYLKKIIFYHLNIFNILSINIGFYDSKEWQEYKYKHYLKRVIFDFEDYDLNQLPENIKHVGVRPSSRPLQLSDEFKLIPSTISIPSHIESISLYYFNQNDLNLELRSDSELKNNKLILSLNRNEKLETRNIPKSITDLNISAIYGIDKLKKNILPPNLKKFSTFNIESFEEGCMPESLESATLREPSSLILNQFSSNTLVKLDFHCDGPIIDSIRFPQSLKELYLICKSFNAVLPDGLKVFDISLETFSNEIKFPSSLEILKVNISRRNYFNGIFKDRQAVPPNLKVLSFPTTSLLDYTYKPILPNGLERLEITGFIANILFNKELKVNQLPSSLKHLDLGSSFNHPIDVNVLPANLETLTLGFEYLYPLEPLAIPPNLKLLKINNSKYKHPINLNSNTVVIGIDFDLFYHKYTISPKKLHVLRLPDDFKGSSLSKLKLQNKSNLKYLHLGLYFNDPIQLSDLPTQNNIKTLELSSIYKQTINLDHFPNLETLILNRYYKGEIKSIRNENGVYNSYSLKNIIVHPENFEFIRQLDINFYQFIKYKSQLK